MTPLPTIAPIPQDVPDNPLTRAFALNAEGGAITGSGFLLPFSTTTFARNPVDPARMAVVDDRGLLYLFSGGLTVDQGVRVRVSPFLDFEPSSAAENQVRVVQIGWSPDGAWLAFLVDAEADDRDGIWLLSNPQLNSISSARQVFRECPPPMQGACTVNFKGGEPSRYNSQHFEWNNSSGALLITLSLPDEGGRRAFTVVGVNNDPTQIMPIYRYGSASWSWDGTRVLVSGLGQDGRVALRWLDPVSGTETMILDGSARGLWLQDAVERPNGQIVALGSSGGAGSAMSIYDASGTPLTAPIGTTAPERVAWSPDHSAALVVVNDGVTRTYYVAEVSGTIREITASIAGALAVEWIGGVPAIPAAGASAAPTLTPAVASQYGLRVNSAAQVIAPAGVNLRAEPSRDGAVLQLLNAFEWVLLIGGPVEADGMIWWQVQSAASQIGWAAESAGGVQLLSANPL